MKSLYRIFIAPVGVLLYFLLALPFSAKAKAIFKLRKEAQLHRPDFMQGCYWIHASSGEFEYAKAVIREIKISHPGAKILATYSSPSYAHAISSFEGVDHAEPLPFDLQAPIKDFLKRFQPQMLLVARTDLWPEILWQCEQAKIPRILFSCSFPRKPKGVSKAWKSFLYNFLDFIFVIKDSDKELLFNDLEVEHAEIKCMGDTRFDQVAHRLSLTQIPPREDQRLCFLAGSTWSEDEEVLLPALKPLLKENKVQLILVPHEPTDKHLSNIKKSLAQMGIGFSLYSENAYDFKQAVLVIDKVGVLASLYALADISFIGGSFKMEVHSVMESLGAGCLTCVGPKYQNNREAVDFSKIPVTAHWNMVNIIKDAASLRELTTDILQNNYELDDVGTAILSEVQTRKGASHRLVQELERIQHEQIQPHS